MWVPQQVQQQESKMGVQLDSQEIRVKAQGVAIEGRQNLQSVWGSHCRPQEGRPRNGPLKDRQVERFPTSPRPHWLPVALEEEAVPYVNSFSTFCVLYSLPFEALTQERLPGFWG